MKASFVLMVLGFLSGVSALAGVKCDGRVEENYDEQTAQCLDPGYWPSCHRVGTYGGWGCQCCISDGATDEKLGFLALPETRAFSGLASTLGLQGQACEALPQPNEADANAMADQEAAEYCATLHRDPVRVGDFSYDTECALTGVGYRIPAKRLHATAEYRCN